MIPPSRLSPGMQKLHAGRREYRKVHPNIFPVDQRELLRPERVKLTATDSVKDKPKAQVKLKPEPPAKKKPKIHLR